MIEFYKANICYFLIDLIGWKYPYSVNGQMVYRLPRVQNWLSKQIPYGSW